MDFQRKIELVQLNVNTISRADDKDSVVRDAALQRLEQYIESERAEMKARLEAKIAAEVAAPE